MHFDGINDQLNVTQDNTTFTDRLTVALWFRREGAGSGGWDGAIISKWAPDVSSGYYNYFIRTSSNNGYKIDFQARDSSGNPCTYFTNAVAVNNTWYHVALRVNGTSTDTFIDGVKQSDFASLSETCDNSTLMQRNQQNLLMGALQHQSLFFNGSIDDVRVFNRSLSDGEINMTMNGFPVNDTGQILWLKFDDGQGILSCPSDFSSVRVTTQCADAQDVYTARPQC